MGSAFSQSRAAQPAIPGGRLTLTTATPVMSSEAANQTMEVELTPGIGMHYLQALERGNTGCTMYGDASEPTLSTPGISMRGKF